MPAPIYRLARKKVPAPIFTLGPTLLSEVPKMVAGTFF